MERCGARRVRAPDCAPSTQSASLASAHRGSPGARRREERFRSRGRAAAGHRAFVRSVHGPECLGEEPQTVVAWDKEIAQHLSQTILPAPRRGAEIATSGTINSAAALGVGARRSATKSAMVKSISCPIALTPPESASAKIARATISSLNSQRSSMLPPPRATTRTSSGFQIR